MISGSRRTKILKISYSVLKEILEGQYSIVDLFEIIDDEAEIRTLSLDPRFDLFQIEIYCPTWPIVPEGKEPDSILWNFSGKGHRNTHHA